MSARIAYHGAWISAVLLAVLCVTAESLLAPARPGGSWLMLKALPLLVPLRGLLHGRRYTFQWTSMLALAYFTEGIVRAWADAAPARAVAIVEVVLSLVLFVSAVWFARQTAPSRSGIGRAPSPMVSQAADAAD